MENFRIMRSEDPTTLFSSVRKFLMTDEATHNFVGTKVVPGSSGPERMRQAEPEDYLWVFFWMVDFTIEATGEVLNTREFAHLTVTVRLASERRTAGFMALEKSGNPCCVVGYSGPTPHGIRIAPVYTLPSYRGRGYASDLVRRVSQQLLDWGYHQVFLFTDLANPASNHNYQQVGYRSVSDVDQYHFHRRLP